MKDTMAGGLGIPQALRKDIEQFGNRMHDALGDCLVSIILYGSVARGEYNPLNSDVNVMVVVDEVTIDKLDKAMLPVRRGTRDFGLQVMLLSEEDLRRSKDVFPIEFLDMKQNHYVLWGKDVISDLSVSRDYLRLRCEQQIKNLLVRLHHFYLHRAQRSELIESTLTNAISSLLSSISVLVLLKTGSAPRDRQAITEAASRELGLSDKTLDDLLSLKTGAYTPDAAELKSLYGRFMALVDRVSRAVEEA